MQKLRFSQFGVISHSQLKRMLVTIWCGVVTIGWICTQLKLLLTVYRALVSLSLSLLPPCDLLFQSLCDSLRLSLSLIMSGHSPVDMGGWNSKMSSVGQEWKISHSELQEFQSIGLVFLARISSYWGVQEEYFYWIYILKSSDIV